MTPDGEELTTTNHETAGASTVFLASQSAGGSRVRSQSAGGSRAHASSHGGSRMHASTRGGARGVTHSASVSTSEAESESQTVSKTRGTSIAHQQGTSKVETTGATRSVSHGRTPSVAEEESWTTSESVVPFMEIEQRLRPSSIEYVSRDEQAISHIQQMKFQRTGECMVSTPMNPAATFFRFDWIRPTSLSPQVRERNLERVHALPYHSPSSLQAPHDTPTPAPRTPQSAIAAESIPPTEASVKAVVPEFLPPEESASEVDATNELTNDDFAQPTPPSLL
jgi:hypothetical protein